jgi:4-hydroxybutyrate CoA-transferase
MIQCSLSEAISDIQSHHHIFIHSAAATPEIFVEELLRQKERLESVHLYHIHTEGNCDYAKKENRKHFTVHSFFNGGNIRGATQNELAEFYVPIFLSDIPLLFKNNKIELDVALIQVSPPDQHGFCSLGPSVDTTSAAIHNAKKIIAQINPLMPRTFGEQIHVSKIHKAVLCERPLYQSKMPAENEVVKKIAKNITELVEDGSTIQLGIGGIPNAVCSMLKHHKDLGVHTEMFSDGLVDLYHSGAITNKFKVKHPYKIISSFIIGTNKVYDFINNNPEVLLLDCAYTNNPHIISQNPKVVAINSAIEVDLTGQVCSDSIGSRIFSGVGGQMDFIRGAALSKGGKPIIALPSQTSNGESKIVSFLKPGAGVVTTRAHVQYVVTENGVAYLHGKTIRERASALIKIAAPEHRERLEKEYRQYWK